MFKVPIDKIIPVTSARARISSLVKKVNENGSMYVLTRGGRPAAILASVEFFERSSKELDSADKKTPEKHTVHHAKSDESNEQKPKMEKPIEQVSDQIDTNAHADEQNDNTATFSAPADDINENGVSDEQPVKISIK